MKLDAQTILIIFVALQLGLLIFKRRAQVWHFDSDKPFGWVEAEKRGELTPEILRLEAASDDKIRLYHFWFQIERLRREAIPGAFAELGVYKGETAAWIHQFDAEREFHLFDTFEGFKQQDLAREKAFGKYYKSGQFGDTDLISVQKRLGDSPLLHFYPGYFPDTAQDLPETSFALVHLDADLYWPTLQALQYFYPRLAPGGAILIHDYNHNWDGVRQALHEFMPTIPEILIELADRQGSAMIVKSRGEPEYRN